MSLLPAIWVKNSGKEVFVSYVKFVQNLLVFITFLIFNLIQILSLSFRRNKTLFVFSKDENDGKSTNEKFDDEKNATLAVLIG